MNVCICGVVDVHFPFLLLHEFHGLLFFTIFCSLIYMSRNSSLLSSISNFIHSVHPLLMPTSALTFNSIYHIKKLIVILTLLHFITILSLSPFRLFRFIICSYELSFTLLNILCFVFFSSSTLNFF